MKVSMNVVLEKGEKAATIDVYDYISYSVTSRLLISILSNEKK